VTCAKFNLVIRALCRKGVGMKRAQRHKVGCVRFDKRRKTWNYLWYQNGKRRSKVIGSKQEYPTKALAWDAAERLVTKNEVQLKSADGLTLREIVDHYREEKMPKRADTRRSYEVWLNNHILPTWGGRSLNDLQARAVELWLRTLALAPKSKAHIRGVLSLLWDYAMWRGDVPTQRNPMELVTVRGATKRKRHPRSFTV
jgi:hypothetical protein